MSTKIVMNSLTGKTMEIKTTPELEKQIDDYSKMADEHEAMGHNVYRSMFGFHVCLTCERKNKEP